jgi:hypothetical protein
VYSKYTQNPVLAQGKRRESAFIEVRKPALQMTDLIMQPVKGHVNHPRKIITATILMEYINSMKDKLIGHT